MKHKSLRNIDQRTALTDSYSIKINQRYSNTSKLDRYMKGLFQPLAKDRLSGVYASLGTPSDKPTHVGISYLTLMRQLSGRSHDLGNLRAFRVMVILSANWKLSSKVTCSPGSWKFIQKFRCHQIITALSVGHILISHESLSSSGNLAISIFREKEFTGVGPDEVVLVVTRFDSVQSSVPFQFSPTSNR